MREAVREYAARVGQLSDDERRRLPGVFDQVIARIPAGRRTPPRP